MPTGVRKRGAPGAEKPAPLPAAARIAAAVGHEIRSPLATALLYMDIVEQRVDAGAARGPVQSALAIARREILRVQQLVTRVTEIESLGFPVMRPRLVDFGQVVAETISRAAGEATRLVRLEIGRGARESLTDWWDDGAVEQILQNLLSNALKYGQGQLVRVGIERLNDGVRLSVRDRGRGLRAADRIGIFDRRVRTPLARAPGLGLGLWFVRALTEAHRGAVAVRSRPGDGATFTVTLRPFVFGTLKGSQTPRDELGRAELVLPHATSRDPQRVPNPPRRARTS